MIPVSFEEIIKEKKSEKKKTGMKEKRTRYKNSQLEEKMSVETQKKKRKKGTSLESTTLFFC